MTTYQIMIALVGEQPMPNLLPARHYQVEHINLLHTDRTQGVAKRLKGIFEGDGINAQLIAVDAFRIPDVYQVILNQRETWHAPLIFNLTGGTKAMSIAALEAARACNADFCYLETKQGVSVLYRYEWRDHQAALATTEHLTASITLEEFLRVKLGEKNKAWSLKTPATGNEGYGFEVAVCGAVRPFVDELLHSVQIMKDQIELDFLYRKGQHFGIAELKDSKKSHNEGVRQLHTAGQQLGLFTRKHFIATRIRAIPEHLEPWKETGIRFLQLEYTEGQLTDDDREKLRQEFA
jgi:hypothetical protein